MRPMATRNGDVSNGTLFAAVLIVATLGLMASAWDERDFAELRAEATAAKEGLARLAVEHSGYTHFYNVAAHCRVPGKDERLEMVLADPGEPGKGYRCMYWQRSIPGYRMRATATWSRSRGLFLGDAGGRGEL
jgi:hypothetical protein